MIPALAATARFRLRSAVKISDVSTPVVVLSPHHHGALGIFRSLGQLGIPVYAVRDSQWAAPVSSRFCRGAFHWDVRRVAPTDSIARLLEIGRSVGRRPMLIATDDATVALVQDSAAELQTVFNFPVLPAGLARRLSSKREMYFLCREFGVPTPETVFPQSQTDVLRFIESAVFPVVVKGIDDSNLGRAKAPMRVVRSARELLDYYSNLEEPLRLNLMLQEYIPGNADSVWMFNGYFNRRSECLVGFTGQKLRQRPMDTGVTTLGICLENETVDRLMRRLLESVAYRGIVDVGCRYDKRDGQYKLLDVNPRIGCTFRLFVDPRGMDVARACYLDLTGQPVYAGVACEGRKWLVESQDLLELPAHLKTGKVTIARWLRSLQGVREMAWFSWRDPLPFFGMIAGLVRSFLREKIFRLELRRPAANVTPRRSPASENP